MGAVCVTKQNACTKRVTTMALDDPTDPIYYEIHMIVTGEVDSMRSSLRMEQDIQARLMEVMEDEFPMCQLVLMGVNRPTREDEDG